MSSLVEKQISKEFSKPLFSDLDFRFIIIFIVCIVIEVIIVTTMARKPVEDYSEREIALIQERFANFILEKKVRKEERGVDTSDDGILPSDDKKEGVEDLEEGEAAKQIRDGIKSEEIRQKERLAAAEVRRRSREAISRAVSNKGLLGLLTGTGSAASGEASLSIFGDSNARQNLNEDLDHILSSVDGLKSGRGSNSGVDNVENVRGTRSDKLATIDDLVADLENAGSESFSRRGDLNVEAPDDVIGRGKKSAYRSPDAIREVLMGHIKAIRYCYERELKRIPTLKGKISIRITVNPEGRVKNVEIVNSTLNNNRVERCIVARVRLWKDFKPIDPGEGDVTFRQVYTFGY
jgi:TonB family protein